MAGRGSAQPELGPGSAEQGSEAGLRAFVGLGSNPGDRLATLRSAVAALGRELPGTRVVAASSVYETRPLGPSEGAFLNAVVELRTGLRPAAVLGWLLEIEARHGRERRRRWDARTLDLDLLVVLRETAGTWEAVRVDRDGVQVPHPEAKGRDFVLVPLVELVGDAAVVEGRAPGAWLEELAEGERTILRRWGAALWDEDGEVVQGG